MIFARWLYGGRRSVIVGRELTELLLNVRVAGVLQIISQVVEADDIIKQVVEFEFIHRHQICESMLTGLEKTDLGL